MKVIKRDGRSVEFDKSKIIVAIKKAFVEVDKTEENAVEIAKSIGGFIEAQDRDCSVEEIQDIVETKLMESDRKDVAKAYILYRNKRTETRESKSKLINKVCGKIKGTNIENSNANVNEYSFSGKEKEACSELGKHMALELGGLSSEIVEAHKQMLVYQHDLDKAVYGFHNCLNLNFQEIFTNGFRTRNGDVRPPASFSTACQLVAVAFQCQSQVC